VARRPVAPVLIVEDNIELQELMKHLLALRGFEVATTDDGFDALAYLRGGGQASVIVLDLNMPNMDGWTLRRTLQADARFAQIPIVVYSADSQDDDLEGVACSLPKGTTDPDALLDAIAQAFAGRH
jgi:two-component system chemotaxis response regulator CheY